MSSSLRAHGAIPETTKFHHIKTVGYFNESAGSVFPVPFYVRNGVIDIRMEDGIQEDVIDNLTPGTGDIEGLCKSMGGISLATKLGPKFIEWLNNWVEEFYNDSVRDTFTVEVPATMTKVQVTDENSQDFEVLENDIDDAPWGISENRPSGDGFVSGAPDNHFRVCWVFKTPLTIKFLLGGSPRYLTYNTTYAPVD